MIEARTKTKTVNSRVETEVKIAMLLESVPQTVPEQSSLVVNSGRERWKQDVHLNLAFAHKRFVSNASFGARRYKHNQSGHLALGTL